jgi:hypothetical protein
MAQLTISEKLIKKIQRHIKKLPYPELYWDYRDTLSIDQIKKAIEKNPDHPIQFLYEDMDIDTYDYEREHIRGAVKYFADEIYAERGEDADLDEIADELREEFIDLVHVDWDLKQLCRNTPDLNVRIEMFSNYDCINSHWLESDGGYTADGSYFGDAIRQLGLDPSRVKGMLRHKGVKVYGNWRSRKDHKRIVEYGARLFEEIENRSCGANLLTFTGTLDVYTALTTNWKKKPRVTIPKGNYCGFFSNFQGGGSMMDLPLIRDFTVRLNHAYDKSGYLKYGLSIDNKDRYGIDAVYGMSSSFWGREITISK